MKTIEYEPEEYNIYLIGRSGQILIHEILNNKIKERLLDKEVLNNRRIKFGITDFIIED
jgi:hypothetical protein